MTPLERRYRRVLRLLPAGYRAAWEEEMVGTFLLANTPDDPEDAEFAAEYGRPAAAEVGSVVALAVRLRLGGAGASPRAFARGEVVRRIALAGLLTHAVSVSAGIIVLPWSWARYPGFVAGDARIGYELVGLVWVVAFLALVLGARRVAFWAAGLGMAHSAVVAVVAVVAPADWPAVPVYEFLVTALPVLAMAAFHRDAPPVRVRPWLVALPAGTLVLTGLIMLTQRPGPTVVDWPGVLSVAVVLAGVVHLVAGRSGPWSAALLVLAAAVLGERVATLLRYLANLGAMRLDPVEPYPALVAAAVVQSVAVAAVIVPLAIRSPSRRWA